MDGIVGVLDGWNSWGLLSVGSLGLWRDRWAVWDDLFYHWIVVFLSLDIGLFIIGYWSFLSLDIGLDVVLPVPQSNPSRTHAFFFTQSVCRTDQPNTSHLHW